MDIILNNRLYEILKWILLIFVPAFITLLTTLTMVWGWEIPLEAIVTTISAVATFLGALIGISTKNYRKSMCDDIHTEGMGKSEV